MRVFVKLCLIVLVALFTVVNLKGYTFGKGISKTKIEDDQSIIQAISLLTDIEQIQYYSKTFKDGDYKYNVYIKTSGDCYLLKATQDDIDAFSVAGFFSNKLKPEKISPIPIYVEFIAMFVILVFPRLRKKKT